jgi:hypothetical protein
MMTFLVWHALDCTSEYLRPFYGTVLLLVHDAMVLINALMTEVAMIPNTIISEMAYRPQAQGTEI